MNFSEYKTGIRRGLPVAVNINCHVTRRHNQSQSRKLTRTGQIGQGNQGGIHRPDALGRRHGTEAKADGKIANANGESTTDSPGE